MNYGEGHLGGVLLNDLFAEPAALMSALVSSGLIFPGDVDRRSLVELLGPDGPMYQVFTEADIAAWRDWTRLLSTAD